MPLFHMESEFACPVEALFAYHARPGAFDRLVPPWVHLSKIDQKGTIEDGDLLVFKIHQGPLGITWRAEHEDYQPNKQFVDRQARGPFAAWRHVHGFEALSANRAKLTDAITYKLPMGPIGALFGGPFLRADLDRMFRFRHQRTRHDLQRHLAGDGEPKTLVFFGKINRFLRRLASFLSVGGHQIYHMCAADPGGNQTWRFECLAGRGSRYPLEEADILLHSGLPYRESRDPEITFDYLYDLAQLLEVAGNDHAHLIECHGFQRSLDHFIREPFISFDPPKPRPLADAGEQMPFLLARVASRTLAYLGCMVSASMPQLTQLLLRLESYVFLKDGKATPEFYWISQEDAMGAVLHLIQNPGIQGEICLAHRETTTRAELQRLLIKRRFFGYSKHRILKILPWTRPGLPAGMNTQLAQVENIMDHGFTPLTTDLATTLDLEEGKLIE
ncbi:SRPBCC family protein [Acanthopleuribacter pedis]|uniref:SRPBCC family protein n=1 Tax=Acanthopleuribacter pedis TaxID=442870 RepID=A0A8J7QAN9_9BACT|nr:SRPBCC family protein [Acanthopleuribacter pedis]MBO1320164.1 SRPBCC family protein [Acanthopleuribacter pedis]